MLRRDRVGARHAGLAILLGHLGSVCRAGLEPRHRELGASSPPGAARPCPDGDQPAVASPEARGLRAFEDERAAEPTRSSSARLLRQRCDAPQRTRRLSTSFTRMRSVTTASTWAGAQAPRAQAISTAAQASQHSVRAKAHRSDSCPRGLAEPLPRPPSHGCHGAPRRWRAACTSGVSPADSQARLPAQIAADPLGAANLCLSEPDLTSSDSEIPLPKASPASSPGPTSNQEWARPALDGSPSSRHSQACRVLPRAPLASGPRGRRQMKVAAVRGRASCPGSSRRAGADWRSFGRPRDGRRPVIRIANRSDQRAHWRTTSPRPA